MVYLGDYVLSATVRFMWNSNAVAGESITRATNGTISVYKDNGTTQSTTGVTDTEDFDALTGVHAVAIDLSSDGTFYSAGSDFAVVLSGATIDGKAINAVLAHFSINNRSALRPTTAGRTLDVSAGGEAGVDWANVGSPTTTLALTGTTIASTQKVDVDTIKTNPVVNGGTITFPTTATLASTTNITAGTITTATNVTTVNGLAAGVITAASIAADAITDAKVASDVTIASVTGAVGSVTGNVGGNVTGSVGSIATGGITTASFAAGAIDAAAIAANAIGASELAADAVAEIQSGLSTLDAAGVRAAVGLASANLDTQLTAIDDYLDTEVAAIKAKTDNLPSDPADASDIAAAFSTVNSTLATIAGYIDTEVAAIITQTTAASIRSAVGLASANLDTQLDALPTAAENATAVLTTQMTESYNTDGTAPTLAQASFVIMQRLVDFAIASTTVTVKKIDGTTTAYTLTLDSATAPTSSARAT